MESSEEDPAIGFEDTNINRAVLETKEVYLGDHISDKETRGQKLAGLLLTIWFVVLPFVAIALIVYLLFFNEEDPTYNMSSIPMQNCVRNEQPFKPQQVCPFDVLVYPPFWGGYATLPQNSTPTKTQLTKAFGKMIEV